jgi:hypothetical protein
MAYDPNEKIKAAGGPIAGQFRDLYDPNGGSLGNMQSDNPFLDSKTGHDFSESLGKVFYGDNNSKGLIGGTHQVNPNAWWEISSMPYHVGAVGATARGPSFSGVNQDQSRMQQQGLIQMLQNQAAGIGPSVAQNQLQQATARNIRQSAGLMASGRGPGAAGNAYNVGNMAAQANQQASADSAQLRMQEQLQAQGLLGSVLGQTRGQDQGMAQMQLQDQKMRDDMVMQFMKMGMDTDQANREAALQMEKLKTDAYYGGEGGGGFLGGLFAGLGG